LVKALYNLIHTIPLTVGTPAQSFNVTLTLAERGLFLPSTSYDDSWKSRNKYNHSASTTYQPNGSWAQEDFWGARYSGHLVEDLFHVTGFDLENITFEAFDYSTLYSVLGLDEGFDGVLGLTPPHAEEEFNVDQPSFLTQIEDSTVLPEPIFSLKLPRSWDEEGEFRLGTTNPDLYTGPFKSVKVLPNSPSNERSAWQVPISHIALNTSIPYNTTFPANMKLSLVSEPVMILPHKFLKDFVAIIGAKPFQWIFMQIPCDRRPYLPDMVVGIGGHELRVTAFDYTFEYPTQRGFAPTCVIWPIVQEYSIPDDEVVLGTTFLKAFYTVFDWKEREVRCKYCLSIEPLEGMQANGCSCGFKEMRVFKARS
jgi:hypothetical protein